MAQQTRLDTAADYHAGWRPTLEALAAADQQDVLKAWEGLGYYARARNLHRAAQIVAETYGGRLPRTRRELLELPGIGEYSAGAILSLAFGLHEPILDGNVKRVFSRLADIDSPIDERTALQRLWEMARALVEASAEGQAGVVNEARWNWARWCARRAARCLACPLHDLCAAAAHGTQAQRPVRLPAQDAALRCGGGRHLRRSLRLAAVDRSRDRRMACWAGCGVSRRQAGAGRRRSASLPAPRIAEELAVEIEVHEPLTTVRHAYTHFRITLHAFHAVADGVPQALGCADWRWARLDQLAEYPFPVTDQKIIQSLAQAEESPDRTSLAVQPIRQHLEPAPDGREAKSHLLQGQAQIAALLNAPANVDARLTLPLSAADLGAGDYAGVAPVQTPFAAVLGCSDARVPVEFVFGQGVNALFVVRVAGNTPAGEGSGSLDYAVANLADLRLLAVLGHTLRRQTATVDVAGAGNLCGLIR